MTYRDSIVDAIEQQQKEIDLMREKLIDGDRRLNETRRRISRAEGAIAQYMLQLWVHGASLYEIARIRSGLTEQQFDGLPSDGRLSARLSVVEQINRYLKDCAYDSER